MKTLYLLERDDLRSIKSGEPLTLVIGNAEIILQYSKSNARRSNTKATDTGGNTFKPGQKFHCRKPGCRFVAKSPALVLVHQRRNH